LHFVELLFSMDAVGVDAADTATLPSPDEAVAAASCPDLADGKGPSQALHRRACAEPPMPAGIEGATVAKTPQ
jgi:hypothetical protein